ncbi:flippase-like domain-containing protein [candidate division WOR-3 bacterium]|nr:flippase-like domain-containing protein [candidate division WOR-3 bacterium]
MAEDNSRTRPAVPRWLRFALGLVIVVAALYFLVSRLVRDWSQIPWSDIRFNYPVLVVSFGVLFLLYLPVFGLTWTVLLRSLGERLSAFRATAIISVSQMGKYVPGKVWFTLGRAVLARRHGIPESKTVLTAFMEAGFALLAALLLFGVTVILLPRGQVPGYAYWAFVLVPVCLVCLYPPLLRRIVNALLRRLKQPLLDINLPLPRIVAIVGLYLLMWVVQGFGCFLLINSFYPLALDRLPIVVGGYALAWILGFLSLVTPAGLGVREGILTFAFRFAMPEPVAILAALLTRVWITLAEVVAALALLPFVRNRRKETA